MQTLNLKATHTPVKAYYQALKQFSQLRIDQEMAVRSAFQNLLEKCGHQFHWTLVPEFPIARPKGAPLKADGALIDEFRLRRGLWEAKDEHDDLEKEAKRKITAGYPTDNIIFQAPERAILYQNGLRQGLNEDISRADNLVELLQHFFEFREPHHQQWEDAVAEFSERLPEIATGAKQLIEAERKKNPAFVKSFDDFYALCRQAINPNLSEEAVEKMLIQHLLTERIFRKIFDNPDFSRRNVIAQEIEKVIASLTSRHFNRDSFLHDLDRFYKAIEVNAENATTYSEKQGFLNTVYERFFQGYSPKEADTHGIVYTPQSIVSFMVRSVEDILRTEFHRSLSDKEVHILDPFVGTGNFIVRVMQEIKKTALSHKYENELHCNEVMLLPYYIASMNIEHAYLEATGEYKPFPGICLVDTFELAEPRQAQLGFMTEENTKRVTRQKQSPIFVIIGNPPYNMGQVNENDNNRNRKYKGMDHRIAETYSKDSVATSKTALADPYVKAIRWASDRIGPEGVVALITNSGFLDAVSADGMRKNLARDFESIFILDLGGNVRKNPKLSGTTHNVFGIQVGVSINLFVRNRARRGTTCRIFYSRTEEFWTKEQKYRYLESTNDKSAIDWQQIPQSPHLPWSPHSLDSSFEYFTPIATPEGKQNQIEDGVLFQLYSRGAETTRDRWLYNFSAEQLTLNTKRLIETYNTEVHRWTQYKGKTKLDEFLMSDETRIKWSSSLKQSLDRGVLTEFEPTHIRGACYRPFTKEMLYFDDVLMHRTGRLTEFFPSGRRSENILIWLKVGAEWPMFSLATDCIPDLLPAAGSQCFPFYVYNEDGSNQRENITDWALKQYRTHYGDSSISKWDIFYHAYAVLQHPMYRERYAANMRQELPRIPLSSDFRALVQTGERLTRLHTEYEKQPEYKLEQIERPGQQLDLRVEKMRLTKDRAAIIYNDFLTLKGIPPETYEYRLGNRSALEWIVDQYQVSTDERSGISNDPNREEDPEYIIRLIGQVITVSLETLKLVRDLASLTL